MSDERITALEEKLAHQEFTVHQLSDEIHRQHRRVETLERQCEHLRDRIATLAERLAEDAHDDQPPPHY